MSLSPFLKNVLKDWLQNHPGGPHLFTQQIHVFRSNKKRTEAMPVTRDEASDHFKRTLAGKVEVIVDRWKRQTNVSFCGEFITTIRLRERCKKAKRTPAPKVTWGWQKYDFIPTGLLVLDTGDGEKVLCQDTEKGRRIEDGINGLIIRWVSEAGRKRIERRSVEEAERRYQEEERARRERETELERTRQEILAKQRIEENRVKTLIADAEAWHSSQVLREYILAVERFILTRDGHVKEGSDVAQWLEWAHEQADRIDPLTPNPPSIMDEQA